MLSVIKQYSLSNFSKSIKTFPVILISKIPIFMELIIHTQIFLDIYRVRILCYIKVLDKNICFIKCKYLVYIL